MPLPPKPPRSADAASPASDSVRAAIRPAHLPRRSAWTDSSPSPSPASDRRGLERLPLRLFLDEYVDDRPHRALTTNVSPAGLYMHRVRGGACRESRWVQLELPLPGTGDSIWARGEIRYDELGLGAPAGGGRGGLDVVHGTGVQLVDMARGHRRLLHDFLYESRRQQLQELLTLVRQHRYH